MSPEQKAPFWRRIFRKSPRIVFRSEPKPLVLETTNNSEGIGVFDYQREETEAAAAIWATSNLSIPEIAIKLNEQFNEVPASNALILVIEKRKNAKLVKKSNFTIIK